MDAAAGMIMRGKYIRLGLLFRRSIHSMHFMHFVRHKIKALQFLRTVWALLFAFSLLPSSSHAQAQVPGAYLVEMRDLTEQALAASREAENAMSVSDVKQLADEVFASIWGVPSGLSDENASGAESAHGWKTRWQVTFSDFDSLFSARYGSAPPEISDPTELGIIGRGRYVRRVLEGVMTSDSSEVSVQTHGPHVVHSINNVIGWTKMDDGVTKGERQPRVDLTREWDSPIEFWMSTSDTGWIWEVYAQASNILKTDYDGDLSTAQQHAADMTVLIERALDGVDANGNGTVEPTKMEGGLRIAVQHAQLGQLIGAAD